MYPSLIPQYPFHPQFRLNRDSPELGTSLVISHSSLSSLSSFFSFRFGSFQFKIPSISKQKNLSTVLHSPSWSHLSLPPPHPSFHCPHLLPQSPPGPTEPNQLKNSM